MFFCCWKTQTFSEIYTSNNYPLRRFAVYMESVGGTLASVEYPIIYIRRNPQFILPINVCSAKTLLISSHGVVGTDELLNDDFSFA